MPRITVDGVEYCPAATPRSWGELLDEVDQVLDGRGLIVTDVRFDGLDEPAFRDGPAVERRLDGVAVVEVGTATPVHFVNRCLDDAAGSLPALAAAARDVGEQFRGFDISGANTALIDLAGGVGVLMGIVSTAGGALELDLQTLPCDGGTVGGRVAVLTAHIDAVINAQQQQDWLTVADVLQYDLAPALEAFVPVLDAFERTSTGGVTPAG